MEDGTFGKNEKLDPVETLQILEHVIRTRNSYGENSLEPGLKA